MEYMIVIGFVTLIVISLLLVSNFYTKEVESSIKTNQLDKVAKEIVDKAEFVYYFGEPSKTTIKVFIPKGVKQINIGPNEVSFRVATHSGDTDVFHRSDVNLSGSVSSSYGFHYVTVEAKEGYVWINST